MIDFLVRLHLSNSLWKHSTIGPKDVPVFCQSRGLTYIIVIVIHLVNILNFMATLKIKKISRYKFNDKIFGIAQINYQPFLVFEFRVVIIIFDSNCLRKLVIPCVTFLFLFLLGLWLFYCAFSLDLFG
jgi:hypothetical protein